MKINLRIKLAISTLILIASILLIGGNVKATNYEKTLINPIYEKGFTDAEKEKIIEELNEAKKNTTSSKKRARTYNAVIYNESTYNDLIKNVQEELINRKTDITFTFQCNKRDDTIVDKIIEDAMSEQYANSNSKLGDYISYLIRGIY